MLNFFVKYMGLRGGKAPMHALMCAYRGTFRLTKKAFWLERSFFNCYRTLFKLTSTEKETLIELL